MNDKISGQDNKVANRDNKAANQANKMEPNLKPTLRPS